MHGSVIEFVGPRAQSTVEELQRPHSMVFWIDAGGHLAHVLGDLGVPGQTVNQLGAGSKEPFADGSKTWFGRGPSLLRAFITRKQRLEVDALELFAAIDDQDLRETPMTANALSQDHHAGAIRRRVEG